MNEEQKKVYMLMIAEAHKASGSKATLNQWMGTKDGQLAGRKAQEYVTSSQYKKDKVKESLKSTGASVKEFAKSDTAKNILTGLTNFWNQRQGEGEGEEDQLDAYIPPQKKTILGMHPITFGVVALLVLAGGITAVVMVSKKQKS